MSLLVVVKKDVEATSLTASLKDLIPTLEGISTSPAPFLNPDQTISAGTAVEVRRLTGEFTPAEADLIQTAIAQHDAAAIHSAQQQRMRRQKTALQKSPSTLTVEQRLARLETLLGAE